MTESISDNDRIALEAVLKGIDETIARYLAEIERLSKEYRMLADELYPPSDNEVA